MPNKGERYRRLYGNKEVVRVDAVTPDGYVKIRDMDGTHFVKVESFEKYFEKVEVKDGK